MRAPAPDPFDDAAVQPFKVEADRPRVIDAAERIRITATPYEWRDPATIPPRRRMFGNWLLRGTSAAAIAAGGIGKTTFFVAMAVSLATGRPLLGKVLHEGAQRVWLWNLEDDADELSRAIQACAQHYGITAHDIADRLFVDSGMEGDSLCTAVEDARGFRILRPTIEALVAELSERSIDVLIIDPFISSHAVDENSNPKINAIAKEWGRVAKRAACCIILVHHCRKAGGDKTTSESARGASALVDACRSVLVFNRMDANEAETFRIKGDDERRRFFTVHDDKHSRAPAEKADWFRLASVDLGNGDSVGVAQPWSPPDPFEGVSSDHLYQVQRAIDGAEWREHPSATEWAGRAVASVMGWDAEGDRKRIVSMLKTWIANGALKIVERPDSKRMPRKFIEVGIWQNDPSATPQKGGVGQGVASEADPPAKAATPHQPPLGGGVGGAGASNSDEVGQ